MSRDDNNSGTMGTNKRREKDTHPSHSGSCVIDGQHYWISGWVNTNRDTGDRFFGLRFKPKQARDHQGGTQNPPGRTQAKEPENRDFDDDIPF